jgi:hypothetical protein
VTSLVIQEFLGGQLLRAEVEGISHYWNQLSPEEELDLTREQFAEATIVPVGERRSREYALSFPETRRRYLVFRDEVISRLADGK